jgi:hypothetical protein
MKLFDRLFGFGGADDQRATCPDLQHHAQAD